MKASKFFVVVGLLAILLGTCAGGFLWARSVWLDSLVGAEAPARPSSLRFSQSELRIALPSNPWRDLGSPVIFDPSMSGAPIFHSMVDFPAPFFGEVPGSVIFSVVGGKIRRDGYPGEILSTDDLEKYVRWWIMSGDSAEGCSIRRVELNGIPAVRRSWDDFPESNEIYSILMGPDVFVDIAARINFYTSGHPENGKWVSRGEEIRRRVLQSVEVIDDAGALGGWTRQ